MLTVNEIISATNGNVVRLGQDRFDGISTDSRTIKKGEIFLALKGDNFDGNDFFVSAMKIGGGAIINQDVLYTQQDAVSIADLDYSLITVQDTLKALHQIGKYKRKQFKGPVFSVIGSNGKTTTKELTATILSQRFKTHKTSGNNNNHIGLPRSLSFLNEDTECLVLEMGTNRPGDIRELCEIAHPDYAIITNLGFEHLEGFKSIEGVRDAELEILPFVRGLIVNGDDEFLIQSLDKHKELIKLTYAINNNSADVIASDIKVSADGTEFTVSFKGNKQPIKGKLHGLVNVYNYLAAIATGLFMSISLDEIKEAIASFKGMPMRYEIVEIKERMVINDCYNANPSSMKEAIGELKRLSNCKKRTIAVLADMLEMGHEAINKHKELGQTLNHHGIDVLIATGEMMQYAYDEFRGEKYHFKDSDEAGKFVVTITQPKDILLIKGSRGMRMEKVTEAIKNAL